MTRRLFVALVASLLAFLFITAPARAQNFKVEKFDIKGDGGTDYVAVEAGDRPGVRVARHPHDGRRRRDRQSARRHPEHAGRARRRHR